MRQDLLGAPQPVEPVNRLRREPVPAYFLPREVRFVDYQRVDAIAGEEAGGAAAAWPGAYYDLLRPHATRLDMWVTTYMHVMASPAAIVEWFKGSALRPYLSALSPDMQKPFLESYGAAIAEAYPAYRDGSDVSILGKM